ncbi:MAG: LpxL/LpxP family Kdo(2)-lipid IV(A) lauroyl/palmitoleoyl acyltransferase [Gammaproteobacteria bacterium]
MSKPTGFLAPRYWSTWIALGIVHTITCLPYRLQLAFSRLIGTLMYRLAKRRRTITEHNIARCLPALDPDARARLVRQHFRALGMAFIEIGKSWWSSDKRLKRRVRIKGMEHLQQARERGHGVILLTAHFTTFEIGSRLLSLFTEVDGMYRPSDNPLIDAVINKHRKQYLEHAILRDDARGMLQSLKNNRLVLTAFDQGYRGKKMAMVPFFGIDAPTNVAISRLAEVSKAAVVPFFAERLPGSDGYLLKLQPALEDFPTKDAVADATRLNHILEEEIKCVPEQYIWSHDRFKVVPRD